MSESPSNSRRWWLPHAALSVVAAGYLTYTGLRLWIPAMRESDALARLQSPDAAVRQQTAWEIADHSWERGFESIRAALRESRGLDLDTLESYVYALGQNANPADWELVSAIATGHASGYLRQAAWHAAARIHAARCAELLTGRSPPADEWDRLGEAKARAEIGEVAGAAELVSLAESGEAGVAVLARSAILKQVRPALVAVGRWPLEAPTSASVEWPRDVFETLRERFRVINLKSVTGELRTQVSAAQDVRRHQAKLTKARARIARVLFASPAEE